MPVFYLAALSRYRADSYTALSQLNKHLASTTLTPHLNRFDDRWSALGTAHAARLQRISSLGNPDANGAFGTAHLCRRLRSLLPSDTIFAVEAVTNTVLAADNLLPNLPGSWINCGAGGLGWSGGAALGIKLAADALHGKGKRFVCQIVGDGSFLFTVPSSVYWICQHYNLPILTIVLNNKGSSCSCLPPSLFHPLSPPIAILQN